MKRIVFFIFFVFACVTMHAQEEVVADSIQIEIEEPILITDFPLNDSLTLLTTTTINLTVDKKLQRDWKRLGINTAMYAGVAAISFGVLWVSPESFSNWDKEEIKKEGFFTKWKENITSGPVWDSDDWALNYLAHPYCGAVYYTTARGSGFPWWESFAYSAIMSTFFWEYGIEAFAEVPSWQDLFITPCLGSALGEGFWVAKKAIVKNNSKILHSKFLGGTALFLMDPFNQILDWCGYKEPLLQSQFAPVGYDYNTRKPIWGVNVSMQF